MHVTPETFINPILYWETDEVAIGVRANRAGRVRLQANQTGDAGKMVGSYYYNPIIFMTFDILLTGPEAF